MNVTFENKLGKFSHVPTAELSKEQRFIAFMINEFSVPNKYNKTSLEKTAKNYGITDNRAVKELVEFALVCNSRATAQNSLFTIPEKYGKLTYAYLQQVNLSLRTSTSILLQQYSTPIPIAYLMGIYCQVDKRFVGNRVKYFFEPSAGNGILTVAAKPQDFYVNEIDDLRRSNLDRDPYAHVFKTDGSADFTLSESRSFLGSAKFDAIITNPPFAKLDRAENVTFGGYEMQNLDHLMAIRALELLRNDGRAAIIVGGHTSWDDRGVITQGKNLKFLSYLYKHYFVDDVILVNGDLYSKMGTSFDIRIILLNGRKVKPEGFAPNKANTNYEVVNTFGELYERFEAVASRDDMAVVNPIIDQNDTKYKYKVETDSKGILYFERLPDEIYWGSGYQDPKDENKAFWFGFDNGTSLIPFKTLEGDFVYKGDNKKTSVANSQSQRIRLIKLKYKYTN